MSEVDTEIPEEVPPGAGLVNLGFVGTAAVIVVTAAGALAPDTFGTLTAVVSGVLFAVGVVLFLYGYATGVVRSKDEEVTLAGLFFLSHTAPAVIRFRLRLLLVVQTVAATAAAVARPYTAVAFAVLAPMFGLGVMAAWGAAHGSFFAKDPDPTSGGGTGG